MIKVNDKGPDRSNLTGSSHYWNSNGTWNGTLQVGQRNAKISMELEHILNKKARTSSIENLWFVQRLWCNSILTKFFEVLPKKVLCFSSFRCQLQSSKCRMASFGFHNRGASRAKNTNQCLGCLRMEDQGVLSHQTFLVKIFSFILPPRKQEDWCAFKWVLNLTQLCVLS